MDYTKFLQLSENLTIIFGLIIEKRRSIKDGRIKQI